MSPGPAESGCEKAPRSHRKSGRKACVAGGENTRMVALLEVGEEALLFQSLGVRPSLLRPEHAGEKSFESFKHSYFFPCSPPNFASQDLGSGAVAFTTKTPVVDNPIAGGVFSANLEMLALANSSSILSE